MNPNIEVITPELWAVNSEYVKAGWIRELSITESGMNSGNKYASLTNDGIMILKKESDCYPPLKQFLPKVMRHTDEELQNCIHFMEHKPVLNTYEQIYLNVLQWERERRRVRAEYLKSRPVPTWKDKIKAFMRKVGEKIYGNT